jgi:UDP-N-acetyl-D-mannosaminuronic acid transferase (WecB/TagA/CpsF family)
LDWLALVQSTPAEANGPARVQALLRRQGISRLIFVTGARAETSKPWVAAWRKHVPVHVVQVEQGVQVRDLTNVERAA